MPPDPSAVASSSAAVALLVLSTDGRVQLANAKACALWQRSAKDLLGQAFSSLFVFEVTSQEPGWENAQWEAMLSATTERQTSLRIHPAQGASVEVNVRLEKPAEIDEAILAYIELPDDRAKLEPPPPAPAREAVGDHFLATLCERSPLGFFDLNFVKNEVYYSPAWKQQLGHDDASLPNHYDSWLGLIHLDDSAAAPDKAGRTTATGTRTFSNEFRMRHARGHYVWMHCVGTQQFGPNGALQRVTGATLDITDRKEFEEASLRADERMQVLGDRGRAGLFDLDFANDTHWLSPGFKALLGYAEGDLPNSLDSVARCLPDDEPRPTPQAYFLSQQPGELSYFDTVVLRHREGRDIHLQACVVRQISRQKELQRVIGFVVPLPEAVDAASEFGVSTSHLHTLLQEIQEGVLLADAHGKIAYLNPKAETLLGRTLGQCVNHDAGDLFKLTHRQSDQPGENPVAKALGTGESTALNTEFSLEGGGSAAEPIAFSTRPVIDAASRPIGAVVVFRRPDEMSLTPEELVRANRFESLGQLASGIAHDFNNLLTTILGGVSLAKDQRDYSGLENSERACLAAKSLSKQLLSFSKGGTAVRQVVKTADVLADSVRLAAAGSTVNVEQQISPNTGTLCVDRAQILQVFQNLLINAIQAMPGSQGGRIWIRGGNVRLTEGQVPGLGAGVYVSIAIKDNGSGIKRENLEKIFHPFFTTKKTGTGLGLATVLSIVKRHGGQIGVESEVGSGTTFTTFLPIAEQPEEVEARRAPSFNFASRTGRILFMDDDPHICTITAGMLENLGYRYDIAHNGEEAVQFYKRYLNIGRPYDLVILDLTIIGGTGGEQCFRNLRDLHAEVRAIIASGYDNEDMARQYLDMGFCGYLTKPYRLSDLGRIMKKVLGN